MQRFHGALTDVDFLARFRRADPEVDDEDEEEGSKDVG